MKPSAAIRIGTATHTAYPNGVSVRRPMSGARGIWSLGVAHDSEASASLNVARRPHHVASALAGSGR